MRQSASFELSVAGRVMTTPTFGPLSHTFLRPWSCKMVLIQQTQKVNEKCTDYFDSSIAGSVRHL